MLNPANDIANTTPGSGNTPFGQFKNDVVPGDNSGTPLIEKWPNDIYYALLAILNRASVTPSGFEENVSTSQFLESLLVIIGQENPSNFLRPRPNDVPDNRVFLSRGVTRDPESTIGEPIIIAEDAASAITHTAVTINGEKRIDRLVHDKAGVVTKKIGTQAVSPTIPPLVKGENPICQVLISTFGATPVIDNVQDIITDDRVQNILPDPNNAGLDGDVVLAGRVNAVGTENLDVDFGSGASFTVNKFATGIYDITMASVPGTDVDINVTLHGSNTPRFHSPVVTDILSATGFGTKTGFRVLISQQVGAAAADIDSDFSFTVRRLN